MDMKKARGKLSQAEAAHASAQANLVKARDEYHRCRRAQFKRYPSEFLGRCPHCLDNAFLDKACFSEDHPDCFAQRCRNAHDQARPESEVIAEEAARADANVEAFLDAFDKATKTAESR